MGNKSLTTHDFLKRAATVASYYGFAPLGTSFGTREKTTKKARVEMPPTHDSLSEEMGELVGRELPVDFQKSETPLQFYHARIREPRSKKQPPTYRFGLTVLGIDRSVAEALVLRSTFAILQELGVDDICVQINSVGDRDSMQRFLRDLNTYLRKNLGEMPVPCREALKRDAYEALSLLLERKHPLLEGAPRPMQFLTDASRRHLKEVIEFLELIGVPYEINTDLMGCRDYNSQTIFEIRENGIMEENADAQTPYRGISARGGRCDELIKKTLRTRMGVVSMVIEQPLEKVKLPDWKPPRARKPKLYFVHLGPHAKIRALSISEQLRKAHIPLRQAIGNDSLSAQLEEAQTLGVPRALIIGQREVLDNTIIIRDMQTHAQTTVPIGELPNYLKSIDV